MRGSRTSPQPLAIRLLRGAELSGRVLDAAGQPVAGVWMCVREHGVSVPIWAMTSVRTDADGTYRLTCIGPGSQSVSAHRAPAPRVAASLQFIDGGRVVWNPILGGGPKIVGRVIDARGAGLTGYKVIGSTATGSRIGPATTDEGGNFTLTGCKPAAYTIR